MTRSAQTHTAKQIPGETLPVLARLHSSFCTPAASAILGAARSAPPRSLPPLVRSPAQILTASTARRGASSHTHAPANARSSPERIATATMSDAELELSSDYEDYESGLGEDYDDDMAGTHCPSSLFSFPIRCQSP